MIKIMTAHTTEPTDTEYAIQEIIEQLGDLNNLLRNTMGLIFCKYEFVESGLVRELCARLPFNVTGCVSQGFAVKNAGEEFMLVLTVLSSDDVEFSAGISTPLAANGNDGDDGPIEELYRNLLASGGGGEKAGGDPALLLLFSPMFTDAKSMTGNAIVRALDRVSGGVPIFGSMAIDITTEVRSPFIVFNGEHYADCLSVVLLRGNVKPRFFAASLPKEGQIGQSFTITEAEKNRLISINNMPAGKFIEKIGLISHSAMDVIYAFPIVVDYHDGSDPRSFAITKIDADGALVSEQDIPVGGTVTIGAIDGKLVIESTRRFIGEIKKAPEQNGLIIASCVSRIMTFQDQLEEISLIQKELKDLSSPFLYFYSGGEICPLYRPGKDRPVNAFHQFTIVACSL
jgi:hypothetical protein